MPGVVTADVEAVRKAANESLSFYERFLSCRRVIELSGGTRAVDLAVIGDEETVAAEVRRYREAGATVSRQDGGAVKCVTGRARRSPSTVMSTASL